MGFETPRPPEAIKRDFDEELPPIQLRSTTSRIESFLQVSLGKAIKGEIAKEEARKVVERFGDSLEVTNIDFLTIITHLEHLGSLPEKFVKCMREKGIKIKIGYKDMLGLSEDERFRNQGPNGWSGRRKDWSKIPGVWDQRNKTVYAGKGSHGSSSLVLHEFGHGVVDLLGLDNSSDLIEAHKRLHPKLCLYLQRDGPGGYAGRKELFAEGFADYFRLSKNKFIKRYDEKFYLFIEGVIINNSTI